MLIGASSTERIESAIITKEKQDSQIRLFPQLAKVILCPAKQEIYIGIE
jgi:hypothetical protein